ncbi:DUF5103 domain-containing protein [bacterium SCSIO 12741]|nr:DUF5103 domain-containing protein [bacterium SCSIO 12741]
MRYLLLVLVFLSIQPAGMAQDEVPDYVSAPRPENRNRVYDDDIHTVQLVRNNGYLNDPIIRLGRRETLSLLFDDFSMEVRDINYRIIHCDANWETSDVDFWEYADGMEEGYDNQYEFSRAMNQRYIHYRITFPNEEMQIKASGNYIIQVYRDGDPTKMMITRRFMVVEDRVRLQVNVGKAFDPALRFQKQEVDVIIDHPGYPIYNPSQDVHLVILQNQRWDNAITDLKPIFIEADRLRYDYEEENTFFAGNEYRFFDIRNFNLRSENVEGSIKRPDTIHIFMDKVKPRIQHTVINSRQNIFGNQIIGQTEHEAGSHLDADYAMVYFYLLQDYPTPNTDYYIFGGLSDYEHGDRYKMRYNEVKKRYERPLYLKQGFYNWLFHSVKKGGDKVGDLRPVEGSFSETKNEYTVLVYHRRPGDEFDRLVGLKTVIFPVDVIKKD